MSAPTRTPPDGSAPVTEEITAPSVKSTRWRSLLLTLAAPIAAFVLAVVVVSIVVLASGRGLDEVFDSIGNTMGLGRNVIDMINKAGMYYISALAVAVGFQMNLFNIGVEGQYRLAALFAAYVGASVGDLPAPLHILVMMVTATVVGGLWAGIAGVLKVTRGVSEVISTIMLNAISAALIGFLLRDGGFSPDPAGRKPSTEELPESGWFPNINGLVDPLLELFGFEAPPKSSNAYGFIMIAIVLGIVYAFMLNRTRFGFDLRAAGQSPGAAQASGVSAKRMTIIAMLISGALAGLAGMAELLGGRQHAFDETFVAGIGWAGISVALLGRNNPIGMFFASLIWAFLDIATRGFQTIGISNKLAAIMQAVVLLAVVVAYTVVSRRTKAAEAQAVAASTQPHASVGSGGVSGGGGAGGAGSSAGSGASGSPSRGSSAGSSAGSGASGGGPLGSTEPPSAGPPSIGPPSTGAPSAGPPGSTEPPSTDPSSTGAPSAGPPSIGPPSTDPPDPGSPRPSSDPGVN